MSISELQKMATKVQEQYRVLNKANGHDVWTSKDYALGLVGDTGDLAKLIMAKENLREIENADQKLEHELADCLWSILVLANQYNIELEESFIKTMHELESRIALETNL